ncbi:MAG TPA: hypothetical protein VHZ30_05680, partial [Verrucomicrobiae bacterium]|nr:hypothetical protein [Verrucomicrobiae bacterium]
MKISAFWFLGLVALSLNTALAQQCPPGYYSTNGLLPGVPAEPGYYVPTSGATSPTHASPGFYVPDVAATNQVPAPAGSYCPISGMSAAIPASSGYYVPASGAASMTPASPGFYAVENIIHPGATFQTLAPAGSYCPISGMSAAILA